MKPSLFLENDSEKKSSSFSGQSSETKPNIKLVLVSREPLLCQNSGLGLEDLEKLEVKLRRKIRGKPLRGE